MEKNSMNGEKRSFTDSRYTRSRLRGLQQYKNLSDEEFDELFDKRTVGVSHIKEFEDRIKRKIDSFGEDYDLDDLKANDKLTLRALAQAYIQLEDLETLSFQLRGGGMGIDDVDILKMDKINNMMSMLRKDISNMQTDLDITRKVRKGDENLNVLSELERLKTKAKEFLEAKLFYVWCPKCTELLFTGWWLYPDEKGNKIQLVCNRKTESGEICGEKLQISSRELLEKRGINISNVPDYFK